MIGSRLLRRSMLSGAVIATAMMLTPMASAYTGDWAVEGEFPRTTTPSFGGGFNPNDVDRVSARFDNRSKKFELDLAFFQAPSRGNLYVALGTGRTDGTCDTGVIDIAINAADHISTRTITEQVPYWVNGTTEYAYTWSPYSPGPGWEYVGYQQWSGKFKWRRHVEGRWEYREETRTVTGVDPERHERRATLELDGVDGTLQDTDVIENDELEMQWEFAHPLLSEVNANCLEITVPGRGAPFVLAPPAAPAPAPTPEPAPAPDAPAEGADDSADELLIDEVVASAVRRGDRIELRLTGGEAERMQIRVRRTMRSMDFRRRVVLRGSVASTRVLQVRFSDGTDWTEWERVTVRG